MLAKRKIHSPLGPLYLLANETHLLALDNNPNVHFKDAAWDAEHEILTWAANELEDYFNGRRFDFSVPLDPIGSPFCKKVWEVLRQIPYGEVWSYGKQAAYLKNPKAQRAVGGANGKNPIPIIIPCHRVIGSTGKLTGYSGGMEMKIALLKHEGHLIDGLTLVLKKS